MSIDLFNFTVWLFGHYNWSSYFIYAQYNFPESSRITDTRKHFWCPVYVQASSRRYYRRCFLCFPFGVWIRRAAGKLSFRDAEVTWSRHKSAGDRAKKYSLLREIGVLDYLAAQSGLDKMCFIFGTDLGRVGKCFHVVPARVLRGLVLFAGYFYAALSIYREIIRTRSRSLAHSSERNYFHCAIFGT